jgi:4a-hydroxytetrahydrobiopterin dehydratase
MNELANRQCNNNPEYAPRLDNIECEELFSAVDEEWNLDIPSQTISRRFEFKNYYQTIAFANSVAWIAHSQDHHPDMTVTYKHCTVSYTTHSVDGLSINDFICAARIDALMR